MVVSEYGNQVGIWVRDGVAPVLQKVAISGTVAGLLLELSVEQHFHNASQQNVEAVYTFPLPPDAVLLEMACTLGERVLQGEVYATAQGEQIYEDALEQGDTPVMVQTAGAGYSTVNIGNLQAGEVAVVRYRFVQLLAYVQGQIRIAIPTVIAPRYGNPASAGLLPHQQPFHKLAAEYPCSLQLQLNGALQAGAISSPTHALSVRMLEGNLSLSLDKSARMDRDMVVLIDGLQGQSLAVCGADPATGETVVLASLCAAAAGEVAAQPVAMKVLVDCSGSMAGDSIDSTRRALHEVLGELRGEDSLSLSCFGSTVQHHHAGLQRAAPEVLAAGARWVAQLSANLGGTELELALCSTYEVPGKADLLLLTDGQIADVETVIERARNAGHRLFLVAIGTAPAGSLLQRLADETGGACEFVAPMGDIHGAILRTFRRMRQPPVKDLALDWQTPASWQVAPRSVLFEEETAHALASFTDGTPDMARLSWQRQGQAGELTLVLGEQTARLAGDTLARLAASLRLPGLDATAQRQLALRYRLLTGDTRLVLVHQRAEGAQASEPAVLRSVPQMLAAGWGGSASVRSYGPAVFRRSPSSSEAVSCRDNGMEQYDIPAFLLKSAPAPVDLSERSALDGFVSQLYRHWRQGQIACIVPASLADWSELLPESVLEMLNALQQEGIAEQDVIGAFLAVMGDITRQQGCDAKLCRWLAKQAPSNSRTLQARISDRLTQLTGWAVTRGLWPHQRVLRRWRYPAAQQRFNVTPIVHVAID